MTNYRARTIREVSRFSPNGRLVSLASLAYLALTPVAWLPGVPLTAFTVGKSFAFPTAVVLTWTYAQDRTIPRGFTEYRAPRNHRGIPRGTEHPPRHHACAYIWRIAAGAVIAGHFSAPKQGDTA